MRGGWAEEGSWPAGFDCFLHACPPLLCYVLCLRSFKEMDVFLAIYEDMFYNAGVDLVSSTHVHSCSVLLAVCAVLCCFWMEPAGSASS